jgi:hypothetical protein
MILKLNDVEELEVLAVLRTLKQVVEEAGDDYVYHHKIRPDHLNTGKGCWYVDPEGKKPDCIVGRVLFRLGVSLNTLQRFEGIMASGLPSLETSAIGSGAIPLHRPALYVLGVAQGIQDTGGNWGDARDAALLSAYQNYGIKGANK